MKERLITATDRVLECTNADFKMQNGREMTKPEYFGILDTNKASIDFEGASLIKANRKRSLEWHKQNETDDKAERIHDPIILKNPAGEIRKSQVEQIKKTIFSRKKQLKHF